MARITMEEQKEFLVFPVDTLLLLKVLEASTVDVPGKDGRDGWTKCSFKFKILQVIATGDGSPIQAWDEMVGKEIFGSVPWRLTDSPENKLRIWSEALLQVEMGLGFDLDSNMFPGRTVKGVTSQYNGKAINPATQQPYKKHQIETLLSAAGGGLGSPVQDMGAMAGQVQPNAGWGQPQGSPQQPQWSQPSTTTASPQQQWATPGVQQQAPAAQPQAPAPQQQWAPQQNLQQQEQPQYAQQPPQAPAQGFAQQQVAAYTQPPPPPADDPWAPPADPNEPGF